LITSVKKINNCSLRHFYKFDEKRARTPRWVEFDRLCKLEKRGDEIEKKSSLKLLGQSQPNFAEMILNFYF
jgi:hypothetical protein